jgi:hypothetical protein
MEIDVCPRWLLTKLGVPLEAQPHLGVLLSTLLAIVISPVLIRLPHFCLMQKLLHIPCPGCGVLHSLNSVLHLDFLGAWRFNPGGAVLAASMVIQILGRTLQLAFDKYSETLREIYAVCSRTTLVMLLVVWIERTIQIVRR